MFAIKKMFYAAFLSVFSVAVFATSSAPTVSLPGLIDEVTVVRDQNGVPSIIAKNERDLYYVGGYVAAQERLFQMDVLRKQARGQLSELYGSDLLGQDIESRVIGIERAGQALLDKETPEMKNLLQAYADGVNHYINHGDLPVKYAIFGISREEIKPWELLDSASISMSFSFLLNFSLADATYSTIKNEFDTNLSSEFDSDALFSEDVIRVAPLNKAALNNRFCRDGICGGGNSYKLNKKDSGKNQKKSTHSQLKVIQNMLANFPHDVSFTESKIFSETYTSMNTYKKLDLGSNSWSVAKKLTRNGKALSANDPHLQLLSPATFYQVQLKLDDKKNGYNIRGFSVPGLPLMSIGCTEHICYSLTNTNGFDYTDIFNEQVVPCDGPAGLCALNAGGQVPLTPVPQAYLVRTPAGLVDSGITATDLGGTVFLLPHRNNGSIISLDPSSGQGQSFQFFASKSSQLVSGFSGLLRAKNIYEAMDSLKLASALGQYVNLSDVNGNIALVTVGAIPIRKDIQSGEVVGAPPYMVRDGISGDNDWLPAQTNSSQDFEYMKMNERPILINPGKGFTINANEDPIGVTLDNDPLNQYRVNGGIYYLGAYGFANGSRAERIFREITKMKFKHKKLTVKDMKKIQSNNQSYTSEVLTPRLLRAYDNAKYRSTQPELQALANDQQIMDAISYMKKWDYSTVTGIKEGYDPGDDPANLPEPSNKEIRHSVAATLYNVWLSKLQSRVITKTLNDAGVAAWRYREETILANLFENFQRSATKPNCRDERGKNGIGMSGLDFFKIDPQEMAQQPNCRDARDYIVLLALKQALDDLAGDNYADAFKNSTNINDYRWGLLHRVFNNGFGLFDAPAAGSVPNLSSELPGASKSGGRDTVDVSPFSIGASKTSDFLTDFGPNLKRIAKLKANCHHDYFDILSLGVSENPASPYFSDQFPLWLSNNLVKRSFKKTRGDTTIFVPSSSAY